MARVKKSVHLVPRGDITGAWSQTNRRVYLHLENPDDVGRKIYATYTFDQAIQLRTLLNSALTSMGTEWLT
jgi:hypothetical protein